MNTDDPRQNKKVNKNKKNLKKNREWKWVAEIFAVTFIISGCFSFISNSALESAGLYTAFAALLLIIFVGILFDIIGVAVTVASADAGPFHGMASRRIEGAEECLELLKNAGKVSSFCNDVIGDICGVISGSAAAAIAVSVLLRTSGRGTTFVPLLLSAMVAAITVGGKAIGKNFAIENSTEILLWVGKFLALIKRPFAGDNKKRGRKNG